MKDAAGRVVLFLGAAYFVVGIGFGELAGEAASHQARVAWRWAAWVVSAVAFGAHIAYERVRRRSSPRTTAVRASSAAALGALGLAAAANVHAYTTSAHAHSVMLALSLVIWPAMTAMASFAVALGAAVLLGWARRHA